MILHPARRSTPALAACALLALPAVLAGCQGSPRLEPAGTGGVPATQLAGVQETASGQTPPEPAGATTAAGAADEATSTPSPTPKCSDKSGVEALDTWASQVPTYNDWAWDTTAVDTSTYDSCASLSWIVLPIERGTASSPYQIMLFHHGEYIGLTNDTAIGFFPEVERLDGQTIQVTYMWPRDGESNAMASGRSVSVFTWDEAASAVAHSGEWPPSVDE